MIVELSPTDRALLAANANVTISLDGKIITETVNKNNARATRRGAR